MANPNWVKGVSGNPKGAPKRPELDLLRKALTKAKKKHGTDFIDHFVDLAYKDTACAIALAKKFLPDMKSSDLKVSGEGGFRLIIERKDADNDRKAI